MKTIFLCYKGCSTCRNAMKFLDNNNVSYEYRDIMSDNPSVDELRTWILNSGRPIKDFFNTRGLVYREMNLKESFDSLSNDQALEILSTTGKLIKRPLLISNQEILIGFNKEEYERLIP